MKRGIDAAEQQASEVLKRERERFELIFRGEQKQQQRNSGNGDKSSQNPPNELKRESYELQKLRNHELNPAPSSLASNSTSNT